MPTTYRITRTPEGMPEGWKQQITFVATDAANFPLNSELAENDGVGYFNGFEVRLKKGDEIKRLDDNAEGVMTQDDIEQLIADALQTIDGAEVLKYAEGFTVNRDKVPADMYDEKMAVIMRAFFGGMRWTLENLQRVE